eukprot:5149857-Pleurochrysis_carterae.AAC.1
MFCSRKDWTEGRRQGRAGEVRGAKAPSKGFEGEITGNVRRTRKENGVIWPELRSGQQTSCGM